MRQTFIFNTSSVTLQLCDVSKLFKLSGPQFGEHKMGIIILTFQSHGEAWLIGM